MSFEIDSWNSQFCLKLFVTNMDNEFWDKIVKI